MSLERSLGDWSKMAAVSRVSVMVSCFEPADLSGEQPRSAWLDLAIEREAGEAWRPALGEPLVDLDAQMSDARREGGEREPTQVFSGGDRGGVEQRERPAWPPVLKPVEDVIRGVAAQV